MLKLLLIIGGFALGLVFNVQGIEGWHLFVEMSIFFMLVNSDIGAGLYHFSHEVIKNFPTAVVSAITPFMGSFLATFVFVYMFSDGMEMITILAICLAVGLIFTATALPIAISFNSIYGNDKVKKTLASVSSTDDVLSLVLSSVVAIALGGLLGSAEASNSDDNVLVEIVLKLGSLLTFGFLLFLLMKYIKNLKAVYSFILICILGLIGALVFHLHVAIVAILVGAAFHDEAVDDGVLDKLQNLFEGIGLIGIFIFFANFGSMFDFSQITQTAIIFGIVLAFVMVTFQYIGAYKSTRLQGKDAKIFASVMGTRDVVALSVSDMLYASLVASLGSVLIIETVFQGVIIAVLTANIFAFALLQLVIRQKEN